MRGVGLGDSNVIVPVIGRKAELAVVAAVQEQISTLQTEGTVWYGYTVSDSLDKDIAIDAVCITREYGIFLLHFDEDSGKGELVKDLNDIYDSIFAKLFSVKELRARRGGLKLDINLICVSNKDPFDEDFIISSIEDISRNIQRGEKLQDEQYILALAALQQITGFKRDRSRDNITRDDSKGAILRNLEKKIAKLDQFQNKAAMETPDGLQRIRGLAGSGKTVVLALKAANLHYIYPDWNILVTFHTRSLYQQFKALISRFYFDMAKDEPNWSRLVIRHSWGGSGLDGVYSEIARKAGHKVHTFTSARAEYGFSDAFNGACGEIVDKIKIDSSIANPTWDAFIIDEAQDLPNSFFEMIYYFVKNPKRIVYAYDELQNLGTYTMSPPEDLFGLKSDGSPNATLTPSGSDTRAVVDSILPVCYRNSPWNLTIAHAVGFGIYKEGIPVQSFDDPQFWSEVGYFVERGELSPGADVVLRRDHQSTPRYFEEYLRPGESFCTKTFGTFAEQIEATAQGIIKNLIEDELKKDDILVIVCDNTQVNEVAANLNNILSQSNIPTHLAGVTDSLNILFSEDSVAISGIFRAKGNEASMVYLLASEYCYSGLELIRRRNILFTGITRSKGWVNIFGVGPEMKKLESEIGMVIEKNYSLDFKIPTRRQLQHIRTVNRDRSRDERRDLMSEITGFRSILQRLQQGDLSYETLPPDVKSAIGSLVREGGVLIDGEE